jgi:hypothetical protein
VTSFLALNGYDTHLQVLLLLLHQQTGLDEAHEAALAAVAAATAAPPAPAVAAALSV